jgi:trans-aconitate methyltransferase
MDLVERRSHTPARHPWETARVTAIAEILRDLNMDHPSVLDVGCGDGYVVSSLHDRLRFGQVLSQDIHLEDEIIREIRRPGIDFVRTLSGSDYRADVILLLDVLEHVEKPVELLKELADERLLPGGRIVITVPAFQRLSTRHDRVLKHFRRYSMSGLLDHVTKAGFEAQSSGYLFSSLLLPRALSVLLEKFRSPNQNTNSNGIGHWRGGERLTRVLHGALTLDNRLCLAARRHGLTVPGLTIWMTCQKPS